MRCLQSPYAKYYQANGQVISQKMFGLHGKTTPGKEEALKTNGGMIYYQYNGQRSVTELTNRHGDKIEHYRYDAFGNIQTGITAPYNTVSYTGQRYDDKTGLINMNARWYNASTGRFTTEDTWMGDLFNPQSLNKYCYVMNNPVNLWDPTGNVPDWVKEQKTHLEFYETGGQIEYAYYFQKYDTGSNGLERIGEHDYSDRIEYYYEEQVYHNWLYSVVYCYNYREVEEEFGNIVWDFDKEETEKIYSEIDYYYETITKYADEIANDVLQKIQQLVGNPPSNTGKPAFIIKKLNGEIINTEIAILGTKKNLSDNEKTAVKVVQLKLNEVINAGLAVDGSYEPLTTDAAQYFQKVLNLPANGVMDTKTFTQLQHHYEYLTNEQISYVEREADRRMFEMVNKGTGNLDNLFNLSVTANEFGDTSDTYKIMYDLVNLYSSSKDSVQKEKFHSLALDALQKAREGTPYMYGNDIVMETLHTNLAEMYAVQEIHRQMYNPIVAYSATFTYLTARHFKIGDEVNWDYKWDPNWQVPYDCFNGSDMNKVDPSDGSSPKNYVDWIYFKGRVMGADKVANLNWGYIGTKLGYTSPRWLCLIDLLKVETMTYIYKWVLTWLITEMIIWTGG